MGIVIGLFLIVMGLLAAQDFFAQKVPALKPTLDKIAVYSPQLGLVSLLLGIAWFLDALSALRIIDVRPFLVLVILASSLLMLALGVLFGTPMLHKLINQPTSGFLLKMDKCAVSIKPYQTTLGFVAIVLGVLCFL